MKIWERIGKKKRKDRRASGQGTDSSGVDYNVYRYSFRERLLYGAIGAAGGLGISYLFYANRIIEIVGAVIGSVTFLWIRKKQLCDKRKWQLMIEFRDALAAMIAALSAGYSMENAVAEALRDLSLLYGEERIILRELRDIRSRIDLGVPLDELFYDLGVRSGVSDIVVFSQVYTTARKSGGNLIKVMKRTADAINEKTDIEREVRTMIAGKRLESLCMMVIPLLIIVYLRIFSPGFLNPLYQGMTGRLFMTVALVAYLGAVWWSRRIMKIDY